MSLPSVPIKLLHFTRYATKYQLALKLALISTFISKQTILIYQIASYETRNLSVKSSVPLINRNSQVLLTHNSYCISKQKKQRMERKKVSNDVITLHIMSFSYQFHREYETQGNVLATWQS